MVLLFVSLTFGLNANLRKKIVTYSDFVYKELVVYAIASLHRNIPLMFDGYKPPEKKTNFRISRDRTI
jgi:hypothetical protein